MTKTQKSLRLATAKSMPPLRHKHPDKEFDCSDSQVVNWLIAQPMIAQYLFDKVKVLGYIVYDQETGTWRGIDYGD